MSNKIYKSDQPVKKGIYTDTWSMRMIQSFLAGYPVSIHWNDAEDKERYFVESVNKAGEKIISVRLRPASGIQKKASLDDFSSVSLNTIDSVLLDHKKEYNDQLSIFRDNAKDRKMNEQSRRLANAYQCGCPVRIDWKDESHSGMFYICSMEGSDLQIIPFEGGKAEKVQADAIEASGPESFDNSTNESILLEACRYGLPVRVKWQGKEKEYYIDQISLKDDSIYCRKVSEFHAAAMGEYPSESRKYADVYDLKIVYEKGTVDEILKNDSEKLQKYQKARRHFASCFENGPVGLRLMKAYYSRSPVRITWVDGTEGVYYIPCMPFSCFEDKDKKDTYYLKLGSFYVQPLSDCSSFGGKEVKDVENAERYGNKHLPLPGSRNREQWKTALDVLTLFTNTYQSEGAFGIPALELEKAYQAASFITGTASDLLDSNFELKQFMENRGNADSTEIYKVLMYLRTFAENMWYFDSRLDGYKVFKKQLEDRSAGTYDELLNNIGSDRVSVSEDVLAYLASVNKMDRPLQIKSDKMIALPGSLSFTGTVHLNKERVKNVFGSSARGVKCAVAPMQVKIPDSRSFFFPVYYEGEINQKDNEYYLTVRPNLKVHPFLNEVYQLNKNRLQMNYHGNTSSWRQSCLLDIGGLNALYDLFEHYQKTKEKKKRWKLVSEEAAGIAEQVIRNPVLRIDAGKEDTAGNDIHRFILKGHYVYDLSSADQDGFYSPEDLKPAGIHEEDGRRYVDLKGGTASGSLYVSELVIAEGSTHRCVVPAGWKLYQDHERYIISENDLKLSESVKYYNSLMLIDSENVLIGTNDKRPNGTTSALKRVTGMTAEQIRSVMFGMNDAESRPEALNMLAGEIKNAVIENAVFAMPEGLQRNRVDGRPEYKGKSVFEEQVEKPLKGYCAETANGRMLCLPERIFLGSAVKDASSDEAFVQVYTEHYDASSAAAVRHSLINPSATYIDGAPGTGKSATIVDVILSCFLNHRKVLFVANNNSVVDDMYNRVKEKFQDENVPLFRYGSRISSLPKSVADAADFANEECDDPGFELKARQEPYNYTEYKKEIVSMLKHRAKECHEFFEMEAEDKSPREKLQKAVKSKKVNDLYSLLLSGSNLQEFLQAFPVVFSTCASIPNLGEPRAALVEDNNKLAPYFDLVIIDEASQVSIANGMAAAVRGGSLLLCGDRNQLRPVLNIDKNEIDDKFRQGMNVPDVYSYTTLSMLGAFYSIDPYSASERAFRLSRNYRCRPEIIAFSKQNYYPYLEVDKKSIPGNRPLKMFELSGNKITRKTERKQIIEALLPMLYSRGIKDEDIVILSPFRNQANALARDLQLYRRRNSADHNGIRVDTVHRFEGQQGKVVILALGTEAPMPQDTYTEFLGTGKELFNVAITRAEEVFILAGDMHYLERMHEGFSRRRGEDAAWKFYKWFLEQNPEILQKADEGETDAEEEQKKTVYLNNSPRAVCRIMNHEMYRLRKGSEYMYALPENMPGWSRQCPEAAVAVKHCTEPVFCCGKENKNAPAFCEKFHLPFYSIDNAAVISLKKGIGARHYRFMKSSEVKKWLREKAPLMLAAVNENGNVVFCAGNDCSQAPVFCQKQNIPYFCISDEMMNRIDREKEYSFFRSRNIKLFSSRKGKIPSMLVFAEVEDRPVICCGSEEDTEKHCQSNHIPFYRISSEERINTGMILDLTLRHGADEEDKHRHYYNSGMLLGSIMEKGTHRNGEVVELTGIRSYADGSGYAKNCTVKYSLESPSGESTITYYDKAVMDEIFSMWREDEAFVSKRKLLRRLTGNPDLTVVKGASRNVDELSASMEKLSCMHAVIDVCTGKDPARHYEGSVLSLAHKKHGSRELKTEKYDLCSFSPEKNLILYAAEEWINPIESFYEDKDFPSKDEIDGRNINNGWLFARYMIEVLSKAGAAYNTVLDIADAGESEGISNHRTVLSRLGMTGGSKKSSVNNNRSITMGYVKKMMKYFLNRKFAGNTLMSAKITPPDSVHTSWRMTLSFTHSENEFEETNDGSEEEKQEAVHGSGETAEEKAERNQ